MPTIADIVNFLNREELTSDTLDPSVDSSRPIARVVSDAAAASGDVAWLSNRVLQQSPERLQRFAGSLVLIPADAVVASAPHNAVRCLDPKLAIIRVIGEFFEDSATTEWPASGNVHDSARVHSTARIAVGAVIGSNTEIGARVTIGPNTCIANATIAPGVTIGCNCTIGLPGFGYQKDARGQYVRFPHVGRVIIEEDVEIGSNTCIDRGSLGDTSIRRGAKIDNLVHIAHNVIVGENALVIAHAMIGGSTRIGSGAWIAPSVALKDQLSIGADAVIGMGAVVIRDVAPGTTIIGNPGKPLNR